MGKAKLKVKEEETKLPEGMKAKDLSVEKRVELFTKEFEKFNEETREAFGIALSVELVFNPKGVVPRLTLVDLLKQEDGRQTTTDQKKD